LASRDGGRFAPALWLLSESASMTTTITDYLAVANNLARYQKLEANKPAVKNATAYYQANIGKVTTIKQFVGNYRLLSYALSAYGLGDQVNNKALVQKVLEQGTTSSKALANTLPNGNWKKFAAAFNFSATGSAAPSSSASVTTTKADYVEQQLEGDQGATNTGVGLALYFARVAPTITSGLQVLADPNLLEVAQTIFSLPPTANAGDIDKEAKEIEKLMPIKDLQDPKKLKSLVERFTAEYDVTYGAGGTGASTPLTMTNSNKVTTVSAAGSVLSAAVSSTQQSLGGSSADFASILSNLALGG
jgi:hypothetical protein